MSATTGQFNFDSGDRLWLKASAIAILFGIVVSFTASSLHPQQADPNNNPAVFTEYAASTNWVTVHLLQALGSTLLLFVGALGIYRSLANESSSVKGWARMGMAMTLVATILYLADMGVDGIALKKAVDAWAGAAADAKGAYFAVAEGIRWLEYGFLGFAGVSQGTTTLFFAVATLMSVAYPKWIGWLGLIGSLIFTVPGVTIFWYGFNPFQQTMVQIGFPLMLVWFIAVAIRMLRA